ncbi:tachykinins [Sabethes cyaneus]|uniref:tachykinins n=1 Tax=Sabethes cyaneus TaxID=53552 RepID=UPI00237E649F|nr:tachykinins [Sabethes cyaneus]
MYYGTGVLFCQDIREKRSLSLNSKSIENYSNINRADNDATTTSPLLGSYNNVADFDEVDQNSLADEFVPQYYLFRPSDTLIPGSAFDNQGNSIERSAPFENYNDYLDPRGKKFFPVFPLRSSPKRAPSGFLGLRGKKYYNGIKRAPLGFTGMRGKKRDETADADFYDLLQKERNLLDAVNDIYSSDKELSSSDESFLYGEKRAPYGFVGLRGKKAFDQTGLLWEVKRAPSGFVGLRGKRQITLGVHEENLSSPYSSSLASNGEKESKITMVK